MDLPATPSLMRPVIRDIIDWIESDLSRTMSSSVIAKRAGYTQWHLQRAFKQLTGFTLIQYIRVRQMTVAAELLKTTTLPVPDIYMRVGYEEGSTFYRPFRIQFGVPPLALRKSDDDFRSRMVEPLALVPGGNDSRR